jgi:hypothetical protein
MPRLPACVSLSGQARIDIVDFDACLDAVVPSVVGGRSGGLSECVSMSTRSQSWRTSLSRARLHAAGMAPHLAMRRAVSRRCLRHRQFTGDTSPPERVLQRNLGFRPSTIGSTATYADQVSAGKPHVYPRKNAYHARRCLRSLWSALSRTEGASHRRAPSKMRQHQSQRRRSTPRRQGRTGQRCPRRPHEPAMSKLWRAGDAHVYQIRSGSESRGAAWRCSSWVS